MSFRKYPEAHALAESAFATTRRKPSNRTMQSALISILELQYNGSRSFFEKNREAVAVVWNGLSSSRRMFMDGARDAGARTLYFELSPIAGRITVDPCGVNFANGLPRTIEPYLNWAAANDVKFNLHSIRDTISARQSSVARQRSAVERPITEPFVFVPLQLPSDTQLRIFGGNFKTVEATIEALSMVARSLPDGWHLRFKEHPNSRISFKEIFNRFGHAKVVVDNATDTFSQVAAARAVITVNSSVGLEAMFFEKPVVALGDCFWAIPRVAERCADLAALTRLLASPETLRVDREARMAFLSFLTEVYYPKLPRDGAPMVPAEVEKVSARLRGPDRFGFWVGARL